jgi:hypothetical protein
MDRPFQKVATLRYGSNTLPDNIIPFLEDFARTTDECAHKPVRAFNLVNVELQQSSSSIWIPVRQAYNIHFGHQTLGDRFNSCGLAYGGPSLQATGWDLVTGDPAIQTNPFTMSSSGSLSLVKGRQ